MYKQLITVFNATRGNMLGAGRLGVICVCTADAPFSTAVTGLLGEQSNGMLAQPVLHANDNRPSHFSQGLVKNQLSF